MREAFQCVLASIHQVSARATTEAIGSDFNDLPCEGQFVELLTHCRVSYYIIQKKPEKPFVKFQIFGHECGAPPSQESVAVAENTFQADYNHS